MTENELKKLRSYFHSLLGQQAVFQKEAENKAIVTRSHPVKVLGEELERLQTDFSGLVPPFDAQEFYCRRDQLGEWYYVDGILSHLAGVLGRLKVAIDTSENTPVTQTREFTFVKDANLRKVLERDYSEIQRAYIAKCWKSVIILSGGGIEATLTDLLLQDPSRARGASKAPKDPDITKWDLSDLINVCVELSLVSSGIEKLSHSVRAYRNLVHPGNEIRNKLTFDEEEARIALEVLHIIHRDLSR